MSLNRFFWAIAPFVSLIFLSLIPAKAQTGEDGTCDNYWVNPQTGQPECLDLGTSSQPTETPQTSSPPSGEPAQSSILAYPRTVKYGPCYYPWQFDFRGRRCGERAIREQQRRLRRGSSLDLQD